MATLLQRQNKIFHQVESEIKKRQFTYKLSKEHQERLANPMMQNILKEHEIIVKRNQKYIDTFFKKKAIDKMDEERKRRACSQQRNRIAGDSCSRNQSSVS